MAFKLPDWAVKGNRVLAVSGHYRGLEGYVNGAYDEPEDTDQDRDAHFVAIHLVIKEWSAGGLLSDLNLDASVNLWVANRRPERWSPDDWETIPTESPTESLPESPTVWERLTEESPF